MASANYEEHLEFYSIKVPDGPLTSRLQHIKPGDAMLVSKQADRHAGDEQRCGRASACTCWRPARAWRRS